MAAWANPVWVGSNSRPFSSRGYMEPMAEWYCAAISVSATATTTASTSERHYPTDDPAHASDNTAEQWVALPTSRTEHSLIGRRQHDVKTGRDLTHSE